jgi:hypothetical protein
LIEGLSGLLIEVFIEIKLDGLPLLIEFGLFGLPIKGKLDA